MSDEVLKKAMNVDSRKQNIISGCIRTENADGKGKKYLFVGNSITLHGTLPEIGWYGDYGMAASDKEHDYVHLLKKVFCEKNPDSAFCICNVADWERQYKEYTAVLPEYEYARSFDANTVIIKVGANASSENWSDDIFRESFTALVDYFNKDNKAKIIIVSEFYHHPANAVMKEYAKERSVPYCDIEDLCDKDKMKALGQYEHLGIQNHPSDLGMKTIAERILKVI